MSPLVSDTHTHTHTKRRADLRLQLVVNVLKALGKGGGHIFQVDFVQLCHLLLQLVRYMRPAVPGNVNCGSSVMRRNRTQRRRVPEIPMSPTVAQAGAIGAAHHTTPYTIAQHVNNRIARGSLHPLLAHSGNASETHTHIHNTHSPTRPHT